MFISTSPAPVLHTSVFDLLRLDGKTALVTGGSRGLGLQISEALGEAGAAVAITARGSDGLSSAEAHLGSLGIRSTAVACDVSQEEQVRGAVERVVEALGPIDILVNNAGATWGAALQDITPASWHKVIRTNLAGTNYVTSQVLPGMVARGSGRVIVISSVAGLRGTDPRMLETLAYNTSKGGLVDYARALAASVAGSGVTVNCICPGFFPTKLAAVAIERAHEFIMERTPLRRVGGPTDLQGLMVVLASPAGGGINGQVIAVDGGMTAI